MGDHTQAWLDGLDPATVEVKDAVHLRDIAACTAGLQAAENELAEAVERARAAGDSWSAIAMVLDLPVADAQREFPHLQ